MHAFLNLLREKYGGAETYVQKYCGMSAEDVETIRRNLVVLSQDQVRDWMHALTSLMYLAELGPFFTFLVYHIIEQWFKFATF